MPVPIYTPFLSLHHIFRPYGSYFEQAHFFVFNAEKGKFLFHDSVTILDYSECLVELRELFMPIKNKNADYGGYVFIDFSPTADDKEVMQEMPFNYDLFAQWLFDLVENDYQWKWSLDAKNHCLKGALSCVDEGSPNYKKMVSFRHVDPTKIMLMAYYYDTVASSGVWEAVDARSVNW